MSLRVEVLLSIVLLLPFFNESASIKYVFVETAIGVESFIQLFAGNDAAVKERDNC